MKNAIKYLICLALLAFSIPALAQRHEDFNPRNREKMVQRIEEVRKMRLLDLLDLQGEQVEKFFSVYNKLQKAVIEAKQQMARTAEELRESTEKEAGESDLATRTETVLASMKKFETAVNARHSGVRSTLTTTQYAVYIAFEARFQEELTRMIIQRAKKGK